MSAFHEAISFLPPGLRLAAEQFPDFVSRRIEELRLRAGRSPTVTIGRDELAFPDRVEPVTAEDLSLVLEIATRASTHTALERFRQGYFTVRGGHRIGLCGSVSTDDDGTIRGLRRLSSLNIRIARPCPECGTEVVRRLLCRGEPVSTLILGSPGSGKTTLLRDLIRRLSDGIGTEAPVRVGLADERGEVSALWDGVPQFDVGQRTDVVEGCPKAAGLMLLLRGMTPQVLACDEITDRADCEALTQCANCGTAVLATAHGKNVEDLHRRPLYRELMERGIFEQVLILYREPGGGFGCRWEEAGGCCP